MILIVALFVVAKNRRCPNYVSNAMLTLTDTKNAEVHLLNILT